MSSRTGIQLTTKWERKVRRAGDTILIEKNDTRIIKKSY